MNFSRSFSRGVSAGLFAGVAAIALMPSAAAAQAIEEDTTTLDNDADLTDGEPDVAPAAANYTSADLWGAAAAPPAAPPLAPPGAP